MKTIQTTKDTNNMANRAYDYYAPYGAWHAPHAQHGVPVNVEEKDDGFTLQLFAPALLKENFSVRAYNDVLYIAYKDLQDGRKGMFTLKEYDPREFQRSFRLNGKVDVDRISVSYSDGILKVILPRIDRPRPGTG